MSDKNPDIIFIVLDSARRDMFGCYGNNLGLTPYLDELSEKSTLLMDHYAAGCGSAQAHVSMFLGQHSYRHGVVHNMSEMKTDVIALPKKLSEAGYKSYGHCMASFIPPAGFEDLFGFDNFYYPGKNKESGKEKISIKRALLDRLRENPKSLNIVKKWYGKIAGKGAVVKASASNFDGKASLNYIEEKLTNRADNNPVFAYTTLLHPHTPYYPPEWCIKKVFGNKPVDKLAFDIQLDMHAWINGDLGAAESAIDSLTGLYQSELYYADNLIKNFIESLDKKGCLENTVVIVTADHGELLGEHDELNHGGTVWEEIYRLPCMLYDKNKESMKVNTLTSALDIYPTVLDYAGIINKQELELDGNSLFSEEQNNERYLVVDAPPVVLPERLKKYPKVIEKGSYISRAVRTSTHKYLWQSNGKKGLFSVGKNEIDENNIINNEPALSLSMHDKMIKFYKGINNEFNPSQYPINMGVTAAKKMTNPIIKKELQKLGYL